MYRYTESGLDNIHLVNGYVERDTPYGPGVSIEDMDGLHKVIGRWLISAPKRLTGAELRFLRHELDLSQKKLGAIMGKSEQAISRWERSPHKAIDPMADRLVRIIYSEFVGGNKPVKQLIEHLADLDQMDHLQCSLEERGGKWRVAA